MASDIEPRLINVGSPVRPRGRTHRVWIDRVLAVAWMACAAVFLGAVGRELVFHVGSVQWNSMWESGPLQIAEDANRGRPFFGNWREGPVHLAIYGPLYYRMLAGLTGLAEADRDGMVLIGRWMGIAFLAAGLAGVGIFVKGRGGPWWAAFIGMGCAGALLTSKSLRFVASARPDAMAAALSVLGLTAVLSGRRGGPFLGVVLLAAAWCTKATTISAPLAVILAMTMLGDGAWVQPSRGRLGHKGLSHEWLSPKELGHEGLGHGRRGRSRLGFFAGFYALFMVGVIVGLTAATGGWFGRHLEVASAAPMSPKYAWFMLTRDPYEPQIRYLFVFSALALVTWAWVHGRRGTTPSECLPPTARGDGHRLNMNSKTREGENDDVANQNRSFSWFRAFVIGHPQSDRVDDSVRVAGLYFVVSLSVALLTAMHQGSDRNYLIEPALAAGMVLGAWASGAASLSERRAWLITRIVAGLSLLNPMLLAMPDHFARFGTDDRRQANLMSPYQEDALAWLRALPAPVLCLDSWLAWRAGLDNDLSDSIPYISYVAAGGPDPVAARARRQEYACIVTIHPAQEVEASLYGDIGSLWPGLREAIAEDYVPAGQHACWHAYTPRSK